jgi:hypothetical protein
MLYATILAFTEDPHEYPYTAETKVTEGILQDLAARIYAFDPSQLVKSIA